MKKIIALIVAVLTAAMLFTGCSADEVGLYTTLKQVGNISDYSYSGNMTLKIGKLSSKKDSSIATFKSILNGASLAYSGSVNTKTNIMTLDLKITTGPKSIMSMELPIKLIVNNSNNGSLVDISVPSMLESYITEFASENNIKVTNVTIDGTSYYQFDINALIAQIKSEAAKGSEGSTQTSQSGIAALQSITMIAKPATDAQNKFKEKELELSDQIVSNYIRGLHLDLVKKSGSTYTIKTSLNGLCDSFVKVMTYIGKNTDGFKKIFITAINSFSDDELQSMGLSKDQKDLLIKSINSISSKEINTEMASFNKKVKTQLKSIDSKITYTLSQSDNSYTTTFAFLANNNRQKKADYQFDFAINANYKITAA